MLVPGQFLLLLFDGWTGEGEEKRERDREKDRKKERERKRDEEKMKKERQTERASSYLVNVLTTLRTSEEHLRRSLNLRYINLLLIIYIYIYFHCFVLRLSMRLLP